MNRIGSRMRTGLFAALVAASLGFGARQALAEAAGDTGEARSCFTTKACWSVCGTGGGVLNAYGRCVCC